MVPMPSQALLKTGQDTYQAGYEGRSVSIRVAGCDRRRRGSGKGSDGTCAWPRAGTPCEEGTCDVAAPSGLLKSSATVGAIHIANRIRRWVRCGDRDRY